MVGAKSARCTRMARGLAHAIDRTKQAGRLKCGGRVSIPLLEFMTKTTSAFEALTQLAAKVDAVLQASPASGLERNARQHFVSQLARHGLVTRDEYEIQTALLEKTRAKLKALEARIAELEAERRRSGGN